jgi:hypothetical protein
MRRPASRCATAPSARARRARNSTGPARARATCLRAEKVPASVRVGIWQSHRRVAEHALGHGRATVFLCEDELMFARRIGPDAVRAVGEALHALPRDWMVLYLGHWPLWGHFVRPNVLRCGSACCHAYIASERMLRWLRDHPPDSVPVARIAGCGVDAAFARLPETYAMFPMLAIQRAGRSDNMGVGRGRRKRKLKHLISRSRHRERLLSSLMRPNEILVALLSPVFSRCTAGDARGRRSVEPAAPPRVWPFAPRPPLLAYLPAPQKRLAPALGFLAPAAIA